jgi:predicted GIY-YIG superfamily endonuclease
MTTKKPPFYWINDIDKIYEEAKKYSSRKEFSDNSKGACEAARKLKIFESVCSHMVKKGRGSKRCIYLIEFPDKIGYVGLTNDFESRKKQHMNYEHNVVSKHYEKTGHIFTMTMIEDYMNENDAQIREEFWKNYYISEGYEILNVATTGNLGGCYIVHTFNTCKNDASLFKTRYEYHKNKRSSYESARRNGWLDDICQHMTTKLNSWTYEKVLELTKNYKTFDDFSKKNRGAHEWIRKQGLLDEIASVFGGKKLKKMSTYTKEYCKTIASQYKLRCELKKANSMVYKVSFNNKWLHEFFGDKKINQYG